MQLECEDAGAQGLGVTVGEALPAVVGVQNTSIQAAPEGGDEHEQDPFFRWFFGNPGPNRRSVGFGSGFIISQDGYILTNNHVVADATKLSVELKNGEKYDADVVGTDPSIDLALTATACFLTSTRPRRWPRSKKRVERPRAGRRAVRSPLGES